MLNEPSKDERQETSAAPTPPAEDPQATGTENGGSRPASGAIAPKGQEQSKGTEIDNTHAQGGERQSGTAGAVGGGEIQDSTPDAQGRSDSLLSDGGQTGHKPPSAHGTDARQDEVSPEMDDPFTVTDESEEKKQSLARVLATHHPYHCSEIHGGGDDLDVAEQERDCTIWPEYEEYEPESTLDLIRREGRIHSARIEWRGLRPTLTVVSDKYSPPPMPCVVYSAVHLPNDVAGYQSAREVFDAVYSVLQRCSALSRQQCELLTFWCIASWFEESLDYIPRVTLTGPRYAADLLFTLLSYVCRKAIQLVGINSGVLKQIDMERLRPTLLIYLARASKIATELLDASDYPGYVFAGAGELRHFCCPRVVYIGETYNAKQRMSGLHLNLGRNMPVPMRPYWSSSAIERLQNRLFSYFAFNRKRTDLLEVSPGELQPEFDLMARRLGAVIINNSSLQRRLVELLKGWSEDLRAERAGGIEATVLTAVLNFAHGDSPRGYVWEIAAGVNQIRIERGEPSKLSNEKVGHVLKKLGLRTHRDMQGRALAFDQPAQRLVHELCFEYDVLPVAPQCGYCHELQTQESK